MNKLGYFIAVGLTLAIQELLMLGLGWLIFVKIFKSDFAFLCHTLYVIYFTGLSTQSIRIKLGEIAPQINLSKSNNSIEVGGIKYEY